MTIWSPSWVMSLSGLSKLAIFLRATFTSASAPPKVGKSNRREALSDASKCIYVCVNSCLEFARPPVTHLEPSCTPRNYHWKSFSNIRSGRLACWLFLGCCPDFQWSRGPVAVGWISPSTLNSLPKRLNLNQTRFNPITRISFFSGAPPTSPLPTA